MKQSQTNLRGRFTSSMVALFIAMLAIVSATYAWYIYNTERHTTKVRMAAGTSVNLQISNTYDGTYGSAAVLDSFKGQLVPVSTNKITNGFQKVLEFADGSKGQASLVASTFGKSEMNNFYQTKLYLKATGGRMKIYLSDIGFEDSNEAAPISSAIRVGFVVHKPGKNAGVNKEYIFAISNKKNPQAQYNTATGKEGYVLDSTKTDGTTVSFKPYTKDAYCKYNKNTGEVTLQQNSLEFCTISDDLATQVDVYIWLEGCDEDCTVNLCSQTLKNLAISFAGIRKD